MIGRGSPRREFDYVEKKSCFVAQLSCCCGTGPCRFCCRSCSPVKESTFTRMVYILCLFLSILIMSMFMSDPITQSIVNQLPDDFSFCKWLGTSSGCHAAELMGYMAVYRIGFAVTLYHITLGFATYGVKSSKDFRAGIHNGMWLYKVMFFTLLCLISFFIPDKHKYFLHGWMYTAMFGASVFIVLQLLLLIFFVHSCTDKIQKKVRDGASPFKWYSVIAPCIALVTFILSGIGVALIYIFFANDEACHQNQWFIFCNAGACVIVSVVAWCRKGSKTWGLRLLHASFITLYVTYLTWNAISSAPRTFQRFSTYGRGIRPQFSFRPNAHCGPPNSESITDMIMPYINFIVTIITVVYGSIGVSEPIQCQSLELPGCPLPQNPDEEHERDDTGGQIVIRNEKKSLVYSYSLFHWVLSLACMLLMMHLTAWYTPLEASLMHFGRSWSSVWIKMVSSWLCISAYFVTILCPSVLPGNTVHQDVQVNGHALDFYNHSEYSDYEERDFDEDDDDEHKATAVPLNPSRRPFEFRIRHETTV